MTRLLATALPALLMLALSVSVAVWSLDKRAERQRPPGVAVPLVLPVAIDPPAAAPVRVACRSARAPAIARCVGAARCALYVERGEPGGTAEWVCEVAPGVARGFFQRRGVVTDGGPFDSGAVGLLPAG